MEKGLILGSLHKKTSVICKLTASEKEKVIQNNSKILTGNESFSNDQIQVNSNLGGGGDPALLNP